MVKDKRNKSLKMFEEGLLTTRGSIRKVLLKKFGHKCSSCNLSEWMGKPIPLWTDHVDGCAKNNSPTNMRLICPNCDSQGDTFGSKNRGKGRISLGMKLYD
jgi:Zn finger protein HypA/HybF involved in hydrogenase expression